MGSPLPPKVTKHYKIGGLGSFVGFWGGFRLRKWPISSADLPMTPMDRLRKWPISSADLPMTRMEGAEHHFDLFRRRDFGAISGPPTHTHTHTHTKTAQKHAKYRKSSTKQLGNPPEDIWTKKSEFVLLFLALLFHIPFAK